jgi:Na+:H+ antiporter, NhaA family
MRRVLHSEAAAGVVLILAAAVAMAWANCRWSGSYFDLWRAPIDHGLAARASSGSLRFWINDGLMSVFFLLVGLELRWELSYGILARTSVALLPAMAALGGVIAPTLIYVAFNIHSPTQNGWGVTMATDIAFALGVLALLGTRIPSAVRVLLLSIAIADDILAIIVIAVVYSGEINSTGLVIAATGVLVMVLMQRLGLRGLASHVLPGALVWLGLYQAHIHPSVAGAVLGLLTPPRRNSTAAPAGPFESALEPWVAFAVMPLFALANAGVAVGQLHWGDTAAVKVTLGIVAGLVAGKPLGIVLATLCAVKLGVASLPDGVGWRAVVLLGTIAGVGFTMAIFIANLAFADPPLLDAAKFGVLLASSLAAVAALIFGRLAWRHSSS